MPTGANLILGQSRTDDNAHINGTTLKEEVVKAGLINDKEYDKIMSPLKMTKPK